VGAGLSLVREGESKRWASLRGSGQALDAQDKPVLREVETGGRRRKQKRDPSTSVGMTGLEERREEFKI
jgi:hypothetical protein